MALSIDNISEIIKKQIKNYDKPYQTSEIGTVISVGDGIAMIDGLDKVMMGELVLFDNNIYGIVLNLEEGVIGVVIMGDDTTIKEGSFVKRTKRIVETQVGDVLLGRVVNALGITIDDQVIIKNAKTRPVERIAPGIMTRQSVDEPLETGIMVIDAMVPIGKGQRELIIGDRQTGKTAIAIDAILNQKGKNVYCVYVAIGQKTSMVAQVVEKLKTQGALKYTTIVAATASETAPLQYLAPYTGITIAEEWLEQGKDVLIVYDDLSKHAVAYRTMALLLRRAPGREAYPGDVFYLHSRLLERACRLNQDNGGGSITALPIVETQAGDISAYIPTNVISITDGQLFLDNKLFNMGVMPAINVGFSVSRVGSAAQHKFMKTVTSSLKLELAQYRELEAFAQFSSDLDETTKAILAHGERVVAILKQNQYSPLHQVDQMLIILSAVSLLTKWLPLKILDDYKAAIIKVFSRSTAAKKLKASIYKSQKLSEQQKTLAMGYLVDALVTIMKKIEHYNPLLYGSKQEWTAFCKKYPQVKLAVKWNG